MKKLAFLLVSCAILVSSCKKNYVCTCTSTATVGGSTITTTTPYVIPDATAQQAATNCEAFEIYAQANSQTRTCKL